MEKPTRLEVGQRWHEVGPGGIDYTVMAIREDGRAQLKFANGTDGWFPPEAIFPDTFLGGPASPERPVMEARSDGYPMYCLRCGRDWNRAASDYVCGKCCEKNTRGDGTCSCGDVINAWMDGARDFPRPRPGAQTPPTPPARYMPIPVRVDPTLKPGEWRLESPAARPHVIPASCQLERWDHTGPLTALQAIQARKPPEPWVPSCDIDCDIPDAPGTVR